MIYTKMFGFRKSRGRFSFRRYVPRSVIFLIFLSTSCQITLHDINIISEYVQNMQLKIVENKLGNKY